jgi:hypothetical protein
MSDFFGPPPEPPREPPRPPRPPWHGPPDGTLPGIVPLEVVLARSNAAAVCLSRVAAYPTGFTFDLLVLADPDGDVDLDPLLFGRPGRRRVGPDEPLRLGVQFADGARATNVGGAPRAAFGERPSGPLLLARGGGGGGTTWHQTQWVWPLPPPGPLAFVCEWPAGGIELSRHEIDAQQVLDAARRALVIFADAPGEGGGSVVSSAVFAAAREPARPADRPTGAMAMNEGPSAVHIWLIEPDDQPALVARLTELIELLAAEPGFVAARVLGADGRDSVALVVEMESVEARRRLESTPGVAELMSGLHGASMVRRMYRVIEERRA